MNQFRVASQFELVKLRNDIWQKEKVIEYMKNDVAELKMNEVNILYSNTKILETVLDKGKLFDQKKLDEGIIVLRATRDIRHNSQVLRVMFKYFHNKYRSPTHYSSDMMSLYPMNFTLEDKMILNYYKLEIHFEDIDA